METQENAPATTPEATPDQPLSLLELAAQANADNGDEQDTQEETPGESLPDGEEPEGEIPMPDTDPGDEEPDDSREQEEPDGFHFDPAILSALADKPDALKRLQQHQKGIEKLSRRADMAQQVERMLSTREGMAGYINSLRVAYENQYGAEGEYANDGGYYESPVPNAEIQALRAEIDALKAGQSKAQEARAKADQAARLDAHARQNAPLLTKNLGFEVTPDMAKQAMIENPKAKTLTEAVKRSFPDQYADAKVTRQRAPQIESTGASPSVAPLWDPATGKGLLAAAEQAERRF